MCFCSRVVVFIHFVGSIDIHIFTDSPIFFCVYFHSLAFLFSESFPNVLREVCSLKWPVTIKNFALG